MAILTRAQIEKLANIIRKHATWVVWRLLGNQYTSQADIDKLTSDGVLPMGVQTPMIKYSFVLGRMESLLKEAEWKGFSWDQLVEAATSKHTDLQKLQIQAAELSANVTLRGLFDEIQGGLYQDLAQATGQAVTEAVVQNRVDEIGHELLAADVERFQGWVMVFKLVADSVHQVGFAQSHATVEEQGIVGFGIRIGHGA